MLLLHLIVLSIYIIIVVVCMVDVLMENRQPVKTMAWLMVLTFAPILGMVLYFFFGQNTRKKRLISQRSIISTQCWALLSKGIYTYLKRIAPLYSCLQTKASHCRLKTTR